MLQLSTEAPVQSGGAQVMMSLVWQRAPLNNLWFTTPLTKKGYLEYGNGKCIDRWSTSQLALKYGPGWKILSFVIG